MDKLVMTIAATANETRILLTQGPDAVLKARLRAVATPAHRFAGPMLCEAMALWHDQRVHAVVSAESEDILFALGLCDMARELGWEAGRVLVFDDDLGTSGAAAAGRQDFPRLLAEGALDHVGILLGVEMSRLARSNKDWHQLLALCARFGTLIADLDGLYDPSRYNDRLLLGLKGTMSEAELHLLRQRRLQALAASAAPPDGRGH